MKLLPPPLEAERLQLCHGCDCKVDVSDPCTSCPRGRWGPILCFQESGLEHAPLTVMSIKNTLPLNPTEPPSAQEPPPVASMVKTAMQSAAAWALKGFKHTDEEALKQRIETCQSCEFWNPQGFKNTGRCMKCGCSTWAKLRMASEKCPIGKW